jgi:hypothetical protein
MVRRFFFMLTLAFTICLLPLSRAVAQRGRNPEQVQTSTTIGRIEIDNLPVDRKLDLIFKEDVKAGSTTVTVTQNGPVTLPPTFTPPPDPDSEIIYKICKKGTVNFYAHDVKAPCGGAVLGSFKYDLGVHIDASQLGVPATGSASTSNYYDSTGKWGIDTSIGAGPAWMAGPSDQEHTLFRLAGDVALDFRLSHGLSFKPFFGVGWDKQALVESFTGSATSAKDYQGATDFSFGARFGYRYHRIDFEAGAAAVPTLARLSEVITSCTSPTICGSSTFNTNQTLWGYEYLGRVSVPACLTMDSPFRLYTEWSRTGGLSRATAGSTLVPDYSSNRLTFGLEYRFRR